MPDLKTLSEFEITSHIWTEEIAAQYPVIQLSNDHGTVAIALHGAHIIEYIPANQKPVIFTSKEAIYREGKAIRGGIPLCWPWFSAHPTDHSLPSHGYARIQFWQVVKTSHKDGITSISFEINHNQLRANVTITLGESLEISLTTTNLSEEIKTIGGALHSYFLISDIEAISINGMDNTRYLDTLTNHVENQSGDIFITKETDRIYMNTSESVTIVDRNWDRTIIIDKTGSKSTVIWNPWIEKSKQMSDLKNEDYRNFICVETANTLEDVYHLTPGSKHSLTTKITSI